MGQMTIDTVAISAVPLFPSLQVPGAISPLSVQNRDPAQLTGISAALSGVRPIELSGITKANFGKFSFFGTGAAGTFNVLLIGWQALNPGGIIPSQWIPFPLANLTVTLGSMTGPSGGVPINNSVLMADSIVVNSGIIVPPTSYIWTPDTTNCDISMICLDLSGMQRMQAIIGLGTATGANVLFSPF